jgi:hypothetical protein
MVVSTRPGAFCEDRRVIERTGVGQNQADAENEAEVTDAIDQEGLHVGENRRRTGVPETDQQVGNQTHRFPAEEELHEVVAHHQHQHGEGEQRDVAEEAVVARVFLHVADGVDMHHQRHEGNDQHHRGGQRVDQETHFKLVFTTGQPGIDRTVEGVAGHHILEDDDRGDEGDGDTGDGCGMRHPARDDPAEQAGDHGTDRGAPAERAGRVFAFPCLTLQAAQVIHMDALEVAEQHDQDGQTDRRFSSGNGQDEEDENLAGEILR